MRIEYRKKILEDLCIFINRGGSPAYVNDGGILVLNQKCVRDERVSLDEARRTDPSAKAVSNDRRLHLFDILVNSTGVGTLGRVAQVMCLPEVATVDSHVTIVRPDPAKVVPRYLGFVLRGYQPLIEALAEGSTGQTELSRSRLKILDIPVPPEEEQNAIAHILGTLDDKIELNRQMNETLEAMARAILKSWFIDFDPVRAKAAGRDTGHPKQIADHFPDRFDDSELGEIPAGWAIATVDDEFNLTMGQSPPGTTYNEIGDGLPFYQGRTDFGFRFPIQRVCCTSPTRYADTGDTLISVRAPVGDINMAVERCCIGRGVAAARHKTGSRSYTYYFMHSLAEVFGCFEGEGTVFGSISKKDFHNIRRIMPTRNLVDRFEDMVAPIDEKIAKNDYESLKLAALRDLLLPNLLSGEIQVGMLSRAEKGNIPKNGLK